MSSKAAFVNTNPLLNPAVRMTKVVPTPAKKLLRLRPLDFPCCRATNAYVRVKLPTGKNG